MKTLLMLAMLSPMATTTLAERRLKKRSASSYKVEGCFSSFSGYDLIKMLGRHNSNVKCRETCRDQGYVLAATKGGQCHCGNIYPKGHKVEDNQCSTRCRSWTPCYGPQSCCGGPSAHSVSVVGNIDVAKQVLRRLSHEWQTNKEHRNYMKSLVTIPNPQTHHADWQTSFDREGWSLCGQGRYMTGMWRHHHKSGDERIGRIEFAECRDAPSYLYPAKDDMECYNHNWWSSFDRQGWSKCKNGYYMTGLYNTNGEKLYNIEEAKCCRPKTQVKKWGHCYSHDVSSAFDHVGWSKCNSGYYMTGLWRNYCDRLGCIEHFYCCKMGAYNGHSWVEKPDLSIKVKDASGQFKHCSMNAMDKSASSDTYHCKSLFHRSNLLSLYALKFDIEDKAPLNVAKPRPIKGFLPVICSAHSEPYKCTKGLTTSILTSSSLKIGSGFSLAVKVGSSVEVGAGLFGTGVKATFRTEVTATASFNVESSKTNTYTTKDKTDVSVQVPAGTEIMINFLRTVQDLEYKWKAVFELLGKYSVKWKNGQENMQDVTTVLTGPKREMYAFGSWRYPGTNVLRMVISDQYGNEKGSGCEHKAGHSGKTVCSL